MSKLAVVRPANNVAHQTPERSPSSLRPSGNKFLRHHKVSRERLAEAFYGDILTVWLRHGPRLLERIIENDPANFLKICAALLPKIPDQVDNRHDQRTSAEIDAELLALLNKASRST